MILIWESVSGGATNHGRGVRRTRLLRQVTTELSMLIERSLCMGRTRLYVRCLQWILRYILKNTLASCQARYLALGRGVYFSLCHG